MDRFPSAPQWCVSAWWVRCGDVVAVNAMTEERTFSFVATRTDIEGLVGSYLRRRSRRRRDRRDLRRLTGRWYSRDVIRRRQKTIGHSDIILCRAGRVNAAADDCDADERIPAGSACMQCDERRRRSGIPLSSGLIRKRVWHIARSRRPTSKSRARVPVGVVRGGPFGEIPGRHRSTRPRHRRPLPRTRTPTRTPTPHRSSHLSYDYYRIIFILLINIEIRV